MLFAPIENFQYSICDCWKASFNNHNGDQYPDVTAACNNLDFFAISS